MSKAYYNEFDPFAAEWLRNLISAGLIAPGHVDERTIEDVYPGDIKGYTQCHFFAGIGGWSYALRLAGWPDTRPVWTGSCPCQPFSNVGQGKGFEDERHLWPSWFYHIRQCNPPVIFGEQVDKSLEWIDLVQDNLEANNYSVGKIIIPAASVGAQHIRQRLWFVADSDKAGRKNPKRITTPQEKAHIGSTVGLVPRKEIKHFRWTLKPDPRWIVDGLSGEGLAVGAYGNSIVPQVAAEVIRAYMEC